MAIKRSGNIIPIDNFNMGGLADSKWSGVAHSLFKMTGWDPHSKPGILKVAQAMAKDTSTTITALCRSRVSCSNGSQFWGSYTDGKVWEHTSGGTWRLVDTIVPTNGSAGILGMHEYKGYIYIATQSWLHRIKVELADDNDWATDLEENWSPLNLDQTELGSTGQTYTTGTGVTETATHKLLFTPTNTPIESIALNINTVGTGNWTVKIHNSANTEVATATIANGSMATGWKVFTFTAVFYPILGSQYHAHVYSSVGDGTVKTTTTVDFSTANARIYRQTDSAFHPMLIQNQVLYIGNGNHVSQVDVETFTENALDIARPLRIKSLGRIGTDLLVGTYIADNVTETEIIRWNTYSVSYTNSDPIPEVGINSFLAADNFVIVQAGNQGNLYYYDGMKLEPYMKIPGDYSPTAYGEVYPSAVANANGQMLFGFSNGSGNPADQGVYRIARHSRNHKWIMDFPYPISERSDGALVTTSIEIGAVLVVGNDIYASWKNGSTYGIDKLNWSAKIELASLESRVLVIEREKKNIFSKFVAAYSSMPDSCSLSMLYDKDYAGYVACTTEVDDTDRNIVEAEESIEGNTLQLKLTATVSSNNAPELESIAVFTS